MQLPGGMMPGLAGLPGFDPNLGVGMPGMVGMAGGCPSLHGLPPLPAGLGLPQGFPGFPGGMPTGLPAGFAMPGAVPLPLVQLGTQPGMGGDGNMSLTSLLHPPAQPLQTGGDWSQQHSGGWSQLQSGGDWSQHGGDSTRPSDAGRQEGGRGDGGGGYAERGGGYADRGSGRARAADEDKGGLVRKRGETKKQAEALERKAQADKVKCHLHKKPKSGCKFCIKYQEKVSEGQEKEDDKGGRNDGRRHGRRPDRAISEERDNRSGPLELANQKTFGLSGLLQTHIVECAHFKSLLTLETFDQLVDETFQFANSVEPYMTNSGTLPSALFCCLYRFFTLCLDGRQLRRLQESQESAFIRCCGLLYVRLGLPHDQHLNWLGEYLLDDEEFKPNPESEMKITIGEYVEGLLSQDKYYNTVMPRHPMVTKRHAEEKLAPVVQYRKRMRANKDNINLFRDSGVRVEASIGGEWLQGTLVELEEHIPNRPKVRLRMDDGSEEYVHLGMVILTDSRSSGRGRSRSRGRRSRSPNRGDPNRVDWTRTKGRSDAELVNEMRSKEREKAVCNSGKDYARKPIGYKAACALPREQGKASYSLMEEETFVPMNTGRQRAASPSPERESFASRRQSQEHQARMQQLFEKYGNAKAAGAGDGARKDDVDRPDVMRLG